MRHNARKKLYKQDHSCIGKFKSARRMKKNRNYDALIKTVGKIKLSVTNASIEHDHYLYG